MSKRAVIYARYSSSKQREASIESQIRECTDYCKKHDMEIVRFYIDRAKSAKTDRRPDFLQMISDSETGAFDVVVVWKYDRFSRSRLDSVTYKDRLHKNGVNVISINESIASGPEGIIHESLIEGMDEYYSAELARKVIRGQTENALKCLYNGGTPTFGYIIDSTKHYTVDPLRAPIVLECFEKYSKGTTVKEIVEDLRARGIKTVRGKAPTINFVTDLLHNRKFIGEYRYKEVVIPGGIPQIVPEELFDRVQQQMRKNKKAPARHKAEDDYLLTTKLFCGACNAAMVGESGTSSTKRTYHYYKCVTAKKKGTCTSKHKVLPKVPLEEAIVRIAMQKINDDNFVQRISIKVDEFLKKENPVLPALKKQLSDVERGLQNLVDAIQAGIFSISTKERLDDLEQQKKELGLKIAQEEVEHPNLTREQIAWWLCGYRKLDMSSLKNRRRLIDCLINSVYVYDDYILITFNYRDTTETVPINDILRSDLSDLVGPYRVFIRDLTCEYSIFLY